MKRTVIFVLAMASLWGCNQEQQTTQASTETTTESVITGTAYGESFAEENVISVSQLEEKVQEQDSIQAVVSGEIASSCQAKGCWMDVKLADGSNMKVIFKDHGFFLPIEDLAGRSVVFTGTAKRETVSVEDQRHYAKDAGKSQEEIDAITTPKNELRFVADGVILK